MGKAISMLTNTTASGPGPAIKLEPPQPHPYRKIQVEFASSASAAAATVVLEGRPEDHEVWAPEGNTTFSLSGLADSSRVTIADNGGWYRLNVTTISGSAATINAFIEE